MQRFAITSLIALCINMPVAMSAAYGAPPVSAVPANGSQSAIIETAISDVAPLSDTHGELAQRSTYFAFDSNVIRGRAAKAVIEAHGRYLLLHPEQKVILEGHIDKRGTEEYDFALAQCLSESVLAALLKMGVLNAQMEAVSMGHQRSKVAGINSAVRVQNRRVDIVYEQK